MPRPAEMPEQIWQRLREIHQDLNRSGRITNRFGERYVLVHINDPYTRLKVGTYGTLLYVQEHRNIPFHMLWDDGSTLSVLPEEVQALGVRIAAEDLQA